MNRFSTAAKVGVFAVVTTVAAILIYQFVAKKAAGRDGYVVYALMKDATGVAKNSQVKIAGIPVGQVESIRLRALLGVMQREELAPREHVVTLGRELDRQHGTDFFADCRTMGELTARHISMLLEIEPSDPNWENQF